MNGWIRCLDCNTSVDDCKCRGTSRKELNVRVGRDPITGRYRQKSKTVVAAKRDAKKALEDFIDELTGGGPKVMSSTAPFSDAMRKWIDHKEAQTKAAGTLKNYRQHARIVGAPVRGIVGHLDRAVLEELFERHPSRSLDFTLGEVPLGSLTDEHIQFFYDCLVLNGRAPNTVARYHAAIHGALAYAMGKGWISGNPAKTTARPSARRMKDINVPEPGQVRAVIDAASRRLPEHGMFVRLAVATWARRGELVALRRSAVDFAASEVLIDSSMSVHEGLKSTKTGGRRRVKIDPGTLGALAEHFTAMEKRAADAGYQLGRGSFVFSDDLAGACSWHPDTPSRFFDRACADAGVVGVRLHDLRHFGATQALANHVPITTVSHRLGHSTVMTTLNVYAHFIPSTDDLAADLMDALLRRPTAVGELARPLAALDLDEASVLDDLAEPQVGQIFGAEPGEPAADRLEE